MAESGGPEYVYVRSNFDNDRLALHEIDPAHPMGSAVVARNHGTVKVGNTAMVRARLRDQWLVEDTSAEGKKHADEALKVREEELDNTGDRGAALAEQFADNRKWPGAEPTKEEVLRDENPKLAEAQAEAQPKVPDPPKGDQRPEVKGEDRPGKQAR
jgi:hypothetical protein